jgi:hypothetical protein
MKMAVSEVSGRESGLDISKQNTEMKEHDDKFIPAPKYDKECNQL